MGLSLLRPRVTLVSVAVVAVVVVVAAVVVAIVVRRLMGVELALPLALELGFVFVFVLDTNVVSSAADDVVASDADVSVAVVFAIVVAVVGVYVDEDADGQVDDSVGLLASKRQNSSRSRLQQHRHMRGISNNPGSSSPLPVVDGCVSGSWRESASRCSDLTIFVDLRF